MHVSQATVNVHASHPVALLGIVHQGLKVVFPCLPIRTYIRQSIGLNPHLIQIPYLPGDAIPGQVFETAELEHGAVSVLLACRVARAE